MPLKLSVTFYDDETAILRQRLLWLIGLRRYAAVTLMIVAFLGYFFLALFADTTLFVLAVFMFVYNHYYWRESDSPNLQSLALQQIMLDVFTITLALFVTGGFLNPFFTFYFFLVIIAWMVLSYWQSIFVTALVTVCFGLQALAPEKLDLKVWGELPFHVVGAPISFVATTVLTAYFVYIIMQDLRLREREVRAARQQAELELNKLDNILRHLGAGMLVIDTQENLRWGNDRIIEWFGSDGLDPNRACYRILRAAQSMVRQTYHETPPSLNEEMALPTLSLGLRHFELIVTAANDARGRLEQIVELVLDVTEQKRNQIHWSQAQRLAAVGQLAAGVAHEINTPLGTINILSNEALDILTERPPALDDVRDSLQTIAEQTQRCKSITQTLLNVSRKPNVAREICSINEMIETSLDLVRHRLNGIRIEQDLQQDLPMIETDRSGLERAIFNLLLNAADAVKDGKPDPMIIVHTCHDGEKIAIEIRDNGIGISEENRSRIFEPFFTTKDVGKGTGLGLYVTYGIVQDLGGTLNIESAVNEGTMVRIEIPVHYDG